MANKLYVGNLNFNTTEDDLRELFKECGNIVSVKIVIDAYTDKSRGFGFVELESADEVNKAIASINGRELNGRALKVNEALDKRKRDFNRNSRRY